MVGGRVALVGEVQQEGEGGKGSVGDSEGGRCTVSNSTSLEERRGKHDLQKDIIFFEVCRIVARKYLGMYSGT